MKKLLSILFLLGITVGLHAQFIPGVVASSKKVEDEAPLNHIYNGDFALGSDGWTAASPLVIENNACYYPNSGYPSLFQASHNMVSPLLSDGNYILTFDGSPDATEMFLRITGINFENIGIGERLVGVGANQINFTVPGDSTVHGIRFIFEPYGAGSITNIIIYEDN